VRNTQARGMVAALVGACAVAWSAGASYPSGAIATAASG
jgi:hypothetical protein